MKIKYFVMDVDGTLTNGTVYIGQSGEIMKAFNVKDGYGIHNILIPSGVIPVIITGRTSEIVLNRCKELEIKEIRQGVVDKLGALESIASDLSEVAFIGDDLNDLECIKAIKRSGGLIGCPNDAAKEVKEISDYVCGLNGGKGCVREFIEWIIAKQ